MKSIAPVLGSVGVLLFANGSAEAQLLNCQS